MKKLLIGGGLLAVIVAAVVVLTLSNLGPLVKKTVNTLGPEITKTAVEVQDVSVSIFSGEAQIKQFLLGNPKGFNAAQAMSVGSVYVDIDEGSITKNPIIINKIEVLSPVITYEKTANSDNFQQILKNVQQSAKSEQKTTAKSSNETEKQGKKIVINNVIVKGGKVNLTMAGLAGKEITANMPDIHLKDIGKEKQGATPAEAFEKIFTALYGSISADSVTQALNDALKQLGNLEGLNVEGLSAEALKTGGEAGKKAVESATQSATESVKSTTEGLKSLFGKEKSE